MRKLILMLFCLLSMQAFAKIDTPVHWKFKSASIGKDQYAVTFTATIDKGWHMYSQFLKSGGPVPTSFKFDKLPSASLPGKVSEKPAALQGYDPSFGMTIAYHEHEVTFTQIVRSADPQVHLTGTLTYMVCSGQKCLPPSDVDFNIPLSGALIAEGNQTKNTDKQNFRSTAASTEEANSEGAAAHTASAQAVATAKAGVVDESSKLAAPAKSTALAQTSADADHSLLGIFIAGFVGGLAAFFLPCIYPMVPLTVSFFTKRSGTRGQGIRAAVIYGLSIITIYVGLGLLITGIFGASALNEAASSASFNLLFFAILLVFAFSFMGAFEITLPSFFVNKIDQKSESGGWIGLFFMAFTLALVSFSCTGPLIGTLLVEAVSKGTYLGPALGMFGFSLALSLPFTAFAIFPSWLKALPKSGGWLNSVKVSLGLLELALAFKYLTNVDLAYHWGLLSRDLFLGIWIIIFGTLAFYLLGKIRLNHDTEVTSLPLPRLLLAMATLVFIVYLIPGLFGAPLKAISGWLPPQSTQQFTLNSSGPAADAQASSGHKYAGLFHAPDNIDAFYDYEEGLAYAKKVNKPVLLDFTGWSCTNCRKMEASVWSDPQVLKRLKNDYVLISLYVDDRTGLSESEKYRSKVSSKSIRTLGQKWSDLQETQFNTNAQPFYVVLEPNGKPAAEPRAFDLNIEAYTSFLDKGIMAAKKSASL